MTNKLINRILEFSLYGLVFIIPFSKAGIEIFIHIGIGAWALKRLAIFMQDYKYAENKLNYFFRCFRFTSSPLNAPIYSLVLIYFISTLLGLNILSGFRGTFGKLYTYVFVYFITLETIIKYDPHGFKKIEPDYTVVNKFIIAMLWSVVLVLVDSFVQLITGKDLLRGFSSSGLITASFSNPNDFAGWTITVLPVVLALFFLRPVFLKKTAIAGKLLLSVIFLLGVFFLFLSYSRAAWVSFVVSLIFIICTGLFNLKKEYRAVSVLSLVLLITAVSLLIVFNNAVKQRVSGIKYVDNISTNTRFMLWQESLAIIEDFPVLGTGPNTYTEVASKYAIRHGGGIYPHNCYLQMAAEVGLTGLMVFLWLLAVFFKNAIMTIRIKQDFLLLGITAGLIAFLAQSFFDTNLFALKLATLFWLILGFGASLSLRART